MCISATTAALSYFLQYVEPNVQASYKPEEMTSAKYFLLYHKYLTPEAWRRMGEENLSEGCSGDVTVGN
jgi:hypothetical protein